MRSTAFVLLAAVSLPAAAVDFDLNVNGDAARLQWATPLSGVAASGQGDLDFGLLYRRDEPDLTNVHAGWTMHGDMGVRGADTIGGLGVRAQYTDLDAAEGGGFALGGDMLVRLDGFERIAMRGSLWYQPEVLGFGDTEDQLEWAISAGYELIRDAELYVGYREFHSDVQNVGSERIDDGAHIGLHIAF